MRRGLAFFAAFSGAVFAAVYLLPHAWWPWLGLCALLPAGALTARKSRRRVAALCCLGVAAGLCWSAAFRGVFFAPAAELDGRRVQIEFHVSQVGGEGWVIQPGKAPVRAILTDPSGLGDLSALSCGDTVRCTAHCTAATYFLGQPSAFYPSQGVFLMAEVAGEVEVAPADHVPWWCLPNDWNERLAQSVERAFPADVSGFLTALVSGARRGLDDTLNNQLARSGVAHLVAVSGMHLVFLGSFLTLFTGRHLRRRAAICSVILAVFALGVGSPSALRAWVLQMALMWTPLLHRDVDRPTILAAALAALLFVNPYACASVSLQLSFAASVGLILVSPKVTLALGRFRFPREKKWAKWVNKALNALRGNIAASLGAMVFSLPVSMIYFRTLSLVAPAVNLLVVPLAALLFAGSMVVGTVGIFCPVLAAPLGYVCAWPARLVLAVVRYAARIPYGAVAMTDIYYAAFLAGAYVLGFLAVCWRGRARRPWVFLGCGAILLAGAAVCTGLTFRAFDLTAAVLDVGQGQSVVFASQNRVAVLDCGGNNQESAGDTAANFLSDRGFDQIDLLILTHFHSDHVNGLPQLFARMEVEEMILPDMDADTDNLPWILELAREGNTKVTWITANTVRAFGEAQVRLYAPLGDGGANEEGLSAVVSAGDFDILLTGDMNETVEEKLIRQGLPRCEVLVAGHHGSAYATGDVLLDAIRPQRAVVSSGRNSYGHPAQETLERLESRSIPVYRTDRVGNVLIQARGGA